MTAAHATPAVPRPRSALRELLGLWAIFAAVGLAVYSPSLRGEFLSDDLGYIVTNPYVHALTLENLRVLFDPFGAAAAYTANYAPVHLLIHALEWSVFGSETLGWRIVNVLLHAGVAVMLVPVLRRAGVAAGVATAAAAVFLLHPANAEVVAWVFQLKTILCLGFGMGALLAHPRRPALGALLFTLGILCKTTAAFALPVALFFAWRGSRESGGAPARWGWLAVWAAAFALYSAPQLFAFHRLGEVTQEHPVALAVQLRSMVAIAGRYLAMAMTSWGCATFQQPPLATSWLDPWWLASLAVGLPLAFRAAASVLRARIEGGFWLWAAAAYAPVSQIFPFLYPMADRYLYVVLPGLLGVSLLAGRDLLDRWNAGSAFQETLQRVGWMLAFALLVFFGWRSYERAAIFRTNTAMSLDAARHFPDGLPGTLIRARRLAQDGDVAGAVAAIRHARELGFDSFSQLDDDPGFAPIQRDPRFRAVVVDVAGDWIARARARGYATQLELSAWSQAHAARGEWAEAVALLERAEAMPGPVDGTVKARLALARRELARTQRAQQPEQESGDGAKAP